MKKQQLKLLLKGLGAFGVLIVCAQAGAQTITGDLTKQTNAALGSAGGAVRVIDNKGTIKFLQVENGLTLFTNTTPSGGVVTTWQLGGTLTSDTEIDFNGQTFSLANMLWNANADGTATTENPGANVAAADQTSTTGFTLLARDEATGDLLKMLLGDLIVGGNTSATVATDATDEVITVNNAGVPLVASKVWVYRNGAKLLLGTDYTLTGDEEITVNGTSGSDPEDYQLFAGDRIEVQWIR